MKLIGAHARLGVNIFSFCERWIFIECPQGVKNDLAAGAEYLFLVIDYLLAVISLIGISFLAILLRFLARDLLQAPW